MIQQYKETRQEIRDARDEGEDISSDSSDSSFDRQLDDIDRLLDQAVIPGLTSMFYEDQTDVQQARDTADHIKQFMLRFLAFGFCVGHFCMIGLLVNFVYDTWLLDFRVCSILG